MPYRSTPKVNEPAQNMLLVCTRHQSSYTIAPTALSTRKRKLMAVLEYLSALPFGTVLQRLFPTT